MLLKKGFFLIGDGVLLAASIYAAYWLRFDGHVPASFWAEIPIVAALSIAIKLPVLLKARLHMLSWSQVGIEDMIAVFGSVTVATLLFWIAAYVLRSTVHWMVIPRSVLVVDWVLTLNGIGAFRAARRVQQHLTRSSVSAGRTALIVGAGAAGEQLVHSLHSTAASGYAPIGFVDDDRAKLGTTIRGLRVVGGRDELAELVRTYKAEAILIAMPSAPSSVIRSVVTTAREADVREVRIVPGLARLLTQPVGFGDLREVQLADLLGRVEIHLDSLAMETWVRGRKVMVTGAGGSIGAELSRQLTLFHPQEIVLLDNEETALFWVERDLRRLQQHYTGCLADIRNMDRMASLMRHVRPDIVFHAAAYKHVDLMERHPDQAVLTNVLGTLAVARAALGAQVEKFVLISTDKAVNPTSVMGATKRVAEQICLALNGQAETRFMVVRFGNVLGSRGSVVPVFQENIRRGEPITIRGENMRRYFMATSEAVLLVLEAGAIGRGGETFVLDMGQPIRIVDLASDLIRLSGLQPQRDVPIVFTDPLPGEKEYEDLLTAEEGTIATRHERIMMAKSSAPLDAGMLFDRVDALRRLADAVDYRGIMEVLRGLVPSYQPSSWAGADSESAFAASTLDAGEP